SPGRGRIVGSPFANLWLKYSVPKLFRSKTYLAYLTFLTHLTLFLFLPLARSQLLTITTRAGNAGQGSTDGSGSAARFYSPGGVAVDSAGNIYVADTANHAIRKITSGGVVSTLAGLAGVSGSNDGTNSGARFNQPQGIAVDVNGILYVADTGNHTIRKLTPGGV